MMFGPRPVKLHQSAAVSTVQKAIIGLQTLNNQNLYNIKDSVIKIQLLCVVQIHKLLVRYHQNIDSVMHPPIGKTEFSGMFLIVNIFWATKLSFTSAYNNIVQNRWKVQRMFLLHYLSSLLTCSSHMASKVDSRWDDFLSNFGSYSEADIPSPRLLGVRLAHSFLLYVVSWRLVRTWTPHPIAFKVFLWNLGFI